MKTVAVRGDNDCFVVLICSFHCHGQSVLVIEIFSNNNEVRFVRLVRKSYSHTFRRSIWFDCRTQSNSIHGLHVGSIEFERVRFPNVRLTLPGIYRQSNFVF